MKSIINRRKIIISLAGMLVTKKLIANKECLPTPYQSMGPFYKTPKKILNNDMTNNGKAIGQKIKVHGKILNKTCIPISNAIIDIWQANSFGKYNDIRDSSKSKLDKNFNGYLRLSTNLNGEYRFFTIYPGSYKISSNLIRTPHIHFKVTFKNESLITQMYFKGNKKNKNDILYSKNNNNNKLETTIDQKDKNLYACKFDIIL